MPIKHIELGRGRKRLRFRIDAMPLEDGKQPLGQLGGREVRKLRLGGFEHREQLGVEGIRIGHGDSLAGIHTYLYVPEKGN